MAEAFQRTTNGLQYPLAQVGDAARYVLRHMNQPGVVTLEGELGAGKTTLIKAICAALGVEATVNSPTFTLVNAYYAGATPVYHFDLYRVMEVEELADIGFEDYLGPDRWLFVEWPALARPLLPTHTLALTLHAPHPDWRELTITS
jgi:tRNA threonylcarbamoyladenosine biosynthesis protein TsaE